MPCERISKLCSHVVDIGVTVLSLDTYRVVLSSFPAIFIISRLAYILQSIPVAFYINRHFQCLCLLPESTIDYEPSSAERV